MEEQITISNAEITAVISSRGAEVISLKKDGEEKIWQGDPNVWAAHAPLLFPICGGLREDKMILDGKEYQIPKHGFARFCHFETEKLLADSVTFLLKADENTQKQYPFLFELRVTYTLRKSTLEVRYDVTNVDTKPLYFSIGSHEGYACPNGFEECSIIFDRNETIGTSVLNGNLLEHQTVPVLVNQREIQLKKEYFESDSLVFTHLDSRKVVLKNHKTVERITVAFDGFDSLLLWTLPDAKFICIEPWHGIPDYVDSDYDFKHKEGMIEVLPQKTDTRIHTICWENE